MQFFYWLIFLFAIGVAVLSIQNSGPPLVTLRFLFWKYETSLIFALLGSIGVGILVTLLFWIPGAARNSIRSREQKKKIESLEKMLYGPSPLIDKGDKPKEP
jgi:uncharacterized integral membrane protein